MNVISLSVFALPILTGALVTHLLWNDKRSVIELIFKFSLGIGLGLGISSLLYFVYLTFFAGKSYILYVEFALFFMFLTLAYFQNKKSAQVLSPRLNPSLLQVIVLVIAGFVFISSLLGVINYARQSMRGDWDAWMIFNRSARFIYRGQETWQDAFSKDMGVMFHADYPPLVALNVASRWDILNKETSSVPMFQSILFSFASLGLCFGTLSQLKSLGQAGFAVILLSGVAFFLREGGRQQADVPLAFYMLASVVFLFFHSYEKRVVLMGFAGFMAGLAAWTKNEGILFLVASAGIMVVVAFWKRSYRELFYYFIGLLLPLAALLYFKLQLTRPNEFLSGGSIKITQYLIDLSRHQIIFNSFKNFLLHNGGWNSVGIFLVLFVYFLLFRSRIKVGSDTVVAILAIFACQIMGYYVIYLITPNDLEWQLNYSLNRLFVQVYPAIVFTVLIATKSPEAVFAPGLE